MTTLVRIVRTVGPWSAEIHARIPSSRAVIGATVRVYGEEGYTDGWVVREVYRECTANVPQSVPQLAAPYTHPLCIDKWQ